MPRSSEQLGLDRLRVLEAAKEWISTSAIAAGLTSRSSLVGGDCRWLEQRELLESRLAASEKRLMFCIDCREVVTGENYAECRGKEQRPFFPNVR